MEFGYCHPAKWIPMIDLIIEQWLEINNNCVPLRCERWHRDISRGAVAPPSCVLSAMIYVYCQRRWPRCGSARATEETAPHLQANHAIIRTANRLSGRAALMPWSRLRWRCSLFVDVWCSAANGDWHATCGWKRHTAGMTQIWTYYSRLWNINLSFDK